MIENINFDDFEWEEYDELPFDIGDRVVINEEYSWWDSSCGKWSKYTATNNNPGKIEKIEHSYKITMDGHRKTKILYDGYMVMLRGKWPWFKMECLEKYDSTH